MITKTKIAIIAAAAALSLATPAFAQSFDTDFGTGNELASHYQDNGQLDRGNAVARKQVVVRQNRMNATTGMASQGAAAAASNQSPGNSPGGAIGS
jgi:hypothetical protein